jgi:type II secretory pathway component GspD/PulD (secretin)
MMMSKSSTGRLIRSCVLALAASQLAACSSNPAVPPASEPTRTEGAQKEPVILSANRARDTAAYVESEERLSDADWRVLERFGPRAIWEQIGANATARERARRDAKIHSAIAHQGLENNKGEGHDGGSATPRPADGEQTHATDRSLASAALTADAAGPGHAPATQPSGAAAGPRMVLTPLAPAIRPMPVIDESALPVQSITMPDGKVRMIWVLRSYGGSMVASTRDPQTSRRAVTLAAPDLTALVAVLTQHLGQNGTVTPMPRENTLVITCDKIMKPSVLELLSKLDVPQRQVEITAKIFEVSRDFDFQQGTNLLVNRLASDSSQTLVSSFSARRFLDSVGEAAPAQGSALRLMRTFADAGVSLDVTFQLLAEAGMINVVSSPRMTVAVGQTGYMLAGQELPIQSATIVNSVVQTATQYKPVGVQLYITPQAVSEHRVKLHTISIVSSVSGFAPLPTMDGPASLNKSLLNPIIDSREAETAVTIEDGSTLVISGLQATRTATRENKTPGLGDVPGLGWLFKNHRSQQQQTDLYFFVTPRLLEVASAE